MSSASDADQLRRENAALCAHLADLEQAQTSHEHLRAILHESEQRLQQFFSAAFEGIAIHDHGRILDANDALAEMFGYSRSEIIGKHALDLTAPASRELIRDLLEHPNPDRHEVMGLRKDGSYFPAEMRAKNVPLEGRPVRVAVVRDLTEEKAAQQRLQTYAEQLRMLSRRLLEVQELERRHLARELHDEIGQMLTGLKLSLEAMARQPADLVRSDLSTAQGLVRDLTTRVREISLQLRPSMLDDLGLLPTVLWHVERFTDSTHIQVSVQHRGMDRRFPAEVETAAYRVVQEALTNVARHANTAQATVRLWVDDEHVTVQIEDQGRGFDPVVLHAQHRTTGLSGMRERIILLGGQFSLEAQPGKGTRVTACLPLRPETLTTGTSSDC